jgi:hypothetical protein
VIFREHRGDHAASLATLVELANDGDALLDHLRKLAAPWPTFPPVTPETVRLVPYVAGVRLVTLDDYGVVGYLDDTKKEAAR